MTDDLGEAAAVSPDLRAVAESFSEIGAQLAADDTGPTLQAVVDTAVDRVHGAKWASITSLHRNTFSTLVSTAETARLADAIQYAVGSGPCLDAIVDDAIYRPVTSAATRGGRSTGGGSPPSSAFEAWCPTASPSR